MEFAADLAAAAQQIVIGLQLQKETLRQTEIAREPQIRVGGDTA